MKGLTTFSSRAVVVRYICFQAVSVYFYVLVSCSGIVSYLYEYKVPPLTSFGFWKNAYRACLTVFQMTVLCSGQDSNSVLSLMQCSVFEGVFCCRGFFRGDTLIGTAAVKLLPLETKCSLHDSFDVSSLKISEMYTGK